MFEKGNLLKAFSPLLSVQCNISNHCSQSIFLETGYPEQLQSAFSDLQPSSWLTQVSSTLLAPAKLHHLFPVLEQMLWDQPESNTQVIKVWVFYLSVPLVDWGACGTWKRREWSCEHWHPQALTCASCQVPRPSCDKNRSFCMALETVQPWLTKEWINNALTSVAGMPWKRKGSAVRNNEYRHNPEKELKGCLLIRSMHSRTSKVKKNCDNQRNVWDWKALHIPALQSHRSQHSWQEQYHIGNKTKQHFLIQWLGNTPQS